MVAALGGFASHGLDAASTSAIAQAIGISQPCLSKVRKPETLLFLAALDRVHDTIIATFEAAAAGRTPSSETLAAIGASYGQVSRAERQMLLQGFAACGHPEVRDLVERRWMASQAQVATPFSTSWVSGCS